MKVLLELAVRVPRRYFNQAHLHHPLRGAYRLGNEALHKKKKNSLDWTALHETNEWGRTFKSDYDSESQCQDNHLFSSTDDPSTSMSRPASPGPLPYGAATVVRDAVSKRHEEPTNSKSHSDAKSPNHYPTYGYRSGKPKMAGSDSAIGHKHQTRTNDSERHVIETKQPTKTPSS